MKQINQKMIYGIFCIFLIILHLSLLSSTNLDSLEKWKNSLNNSDRTILEQNTEKYELKILEKFANISYPKEDKPNEKFVDLIIYLRDISDADALISGFSQDEIGRVINRNISNRITVKMTKEAFLKLIQDNRVESVYYNAPIQFSLAESARLINANDTWALGIYRRGG